MTTTLRMPILEGGIRSINFFNGRLLSAEDLQQEQQANAVARARMSRALGDGVAYGLQVRAAPGRPANQPTLTVTQGLAVNRLGQTIALDADTDVALVRPLETTASGTDGFSACDPLQPGFYITGAGVYLLTITTATATEGRAPASGLGNIAATCSTRYTVEGVQFRLVSLNTLLAADASLNSPDGIAHLRNLIAYKCFGVSDARMQEFARNPFGARLTAYGLLDDLRPDCLTDADVPLALLYWTTNGIQFVDMWSARRRVIQPAADDDWRVFVSDRRAAEAEALFLQFGDELDDLRANESNLGAFVAARRFRYLPPVGLLPLAPLPFLRSSSFFEVASAAFDRPLNFLPQFGASSAHSFNLQNFFQGKTVRGPLFIESARVEPLIRSSLHYAPVDLTSDELIWLYAVRENRDPRAFAGAPAPLPFVIFARGDVPYAGEARFDVAHWDYSNYSVEPLVSRGVYS